MLTIQTSTTTKEFQFMENLFNGYYRLHIVSSGVELGLFQWLEQGHRTKEEIRERFNLDGQYAGVFLLSLEDLGLLIAEDSSYRNSPLASTLLIKKSPYYQGDLLEHTVKEDKKWGNLTKVIKNEKLPRLPANETYMNAQLQFSLYEQLEVTNLIKRWDGYSEAKSVLDVSSPAGIFAFMLCGENSNLKGEVICPDKELDYVYRTLDNKGLEEAISVQDKSLKKLLDSPEDRKFDIVILSHSLYQYRKELLPTYEKIAKMMNPGGLLISNHWFCSPGCGEKDQGLADLNKAVSIGGHPLCHEERYRSFISDSGFSLLISSTLPSMGGDSKLVMAVRNRENIEKIIESTTSTTEKCC